MTQVTQEISKLIKELGKKFKSHHLSLVTAESCTGGGLAYFISKEPLCSPILERGYVTYSNQAKQSVLKVTPDALQTFGAVSQEVTEQMADGALNTSTAHIAISLSGIAGEDFDPPNKKGLLWIACTGINKKKISKKFHIAGSREEFVHESILAAVKLLHQFVDKFL